MSGDIPALRAARRCDVLVATARELATLRRGGVPVDVLVGSGEDAAERFEPGELDPEPQIVVTTSGALGGWIRPGGPFRAAPLPGAVSDAYGCGDCFAAGLTYGLALREPVDEAVAIGARCGADRPHGSRRLRAPAHRCRPRARLRGVLAQVRRGPK